VVGSGSRQHGAGRTTAISICIANNIIIINCKLVASICSRASIHTPSRRGSRRGRSAGDMTAQLERKRGADKSIRRRCELLGPGTSHRASQERAAGAAVLRGPLAVQDRLERLTATLVGGRGLLGRQHFC
jgi:hypothetical protein